MDSQCFVLDVADSPNGQSALLDFQKGRPRIGMILQDTTGKLKWEVIGISMPILVDFLREKVDTHYGSEVIWNCLIKSISDSPKLEIGNILFLESA